MKHLLNGVAIAAVLAIAAPAWAQAPMSPSSSTAPKSTAAAPAKSTEAAPPQKHKKMAAHHRTSRRAGPPSMTQQLNQAELARVQSGASTPPMPQVESTMPARIGSPKQP